MGALRVLFKKLFPNFLDEVLRLIVVTLQTVA